MNALLTKRVAIIGAGNIGRILLNRLLASGVPAENLMVCDSDEKRAIAAANQFGVRPIALSDEPTGLPMQFCWLCRQKLCPTCYERQASSFSPGDSWSPSRLPYL